MFMTSGETLSEIRFSTRVLFNIDEISLFFHNNILAILRPTMFLLENVIN